MPTQKRPKAVKGNWDAGTLWDEDALKFIEHEQSDAANVEDGHIHAVDRKRWLQAQEYERTVWMTELPHVDDARNGEIADGFKRYVAVPRELGDVIEIGAGPFTNVQYILPYRRASSVTLLDPLIHEYTHHPHCTYADGTLHTIRVGLIALPVEEWEPDMQYDTVVMANVLRHCYDAEAVLTKILDILKPGGVIVVWEEPREIDPEREFDIGHPIWPSKELIEGFLSHFDLLYREGFYFIGEKRA